MKITEGLRGGDLEGLVKNILTIDEYESKIDETAIVVGFFVQYIDSANDLNRFIQKSAIDLLDTEVSPAPTEDGYYVVFVEMERNTDFPKILGRLLENIDNLVDIKKWYFTCENHPTPVELTDDMLSQSLNLNDTSELKNDDNSVKEFFSLSLLDNVLYENGNLTFHKTKYESKYRLISLREASIRLIHNEINEDNDLTRYSLSSVLGAHWLIENRGNVLFLRNILSNKRALLKKL